jgi:hypothetical protein
MFIRHSHKVFLHVAENEALNVVHRPRRVSGIDGFVHRRGGYRVSRRGSDSAVAGIGGLLPGG